MCVNSSSLADATDMASEILGIIGSGNAVSPNRRQANTWTNVLLSIEPLQHT